MPPIAPGIPSPNPRDPGGIRGVESGICYDGPSRSVRPPGSQDNPAVAAGTTGTAAAGTSCATFAAVAARTEQPHRVAAGAPSATSADHLLSACATVTAVAEKEPTVAAGAAGTSGPRCIEKAAAGSSSAAVSDHPGVPAGASAESQGAIPAVATIAEQHSACAARTAHIAAGQARAAGSGVAAAAPRPE